MASWAEPDCPHSVTGPAAYCALLVCVEQMDYFCFQTQCPHNNIKKSPPFQRKHSYFITANFEIKLFYQHQHARFHC